MQRQGRKPAKGTASQGRKQRSYLEKACAEWQCKVCREIYDGAVAYCMSCYQSLYYYCYVNN